MNTLDYIKIYAQTRRNFLEKVAGIASLENLGRLKAYEDIINQIHECEALMGSLSQKMEAHIRESVKPQGAWASGPPGEAK